MEKGLLYLQSKKIGPYMTQLQFQSRRRVGHFDVSISLKNDDGKTSDQPLIEGIYSKGNRSLNTQGWFDIHYSDRADFGDGNPVILSQSGRYAEDVFEMIGGAIEPGGMVFVSLITDMVWKMESDLHRVTRDCLSIRSLGIPPAATPLGCLLFIGGCRNVKSQAFDVQGSSRLGGEKAPNPETNRQFAQRLRKQLQEFLVRKDRKESAESEKILKICRLNAEDILNRIG